jgi:hypothetical protein
MGKKLIRRCTISVVLAAFILPATSAASPEFTQPTGTRVGFGTSILGTAIGTQRLTDTSGNTLFECTGASLTGTMMKNNGSEAEVTIENVAFSGTAIGGGCTSNFGNIAVDTNIGNGTPWCLKLGASDTFIVRGNTCSAEQRSITLVLTSSTIGTCKYSRAAVLKGTFTTHSTGYAVLTTAGSGATGVEDSGITKEEGSVFCPSSGTLDLSFLLERDESPATNPLYIS